MLLFNKLTYKTKLITIYICTTLIGITLTLIAIYNASNEQLTLDHINNVHAIYSDRLAQLNKQVYSTEQLSTLLSTSNFLVKPLRQLNEISFTANGCNTTLSSDMLQQDRINSNGGITGSAPCLMSWVILFPAKGESLIILHYLDTFTSSSIFSAYKHRLLIPLIFFVWITVWGSLILGNLVNRLQLQKDAVEHMAFHDTLTGLPNRKFFSTKISELIQYSKKNKLPFVLAIVDLNKFKNVNDEFGHLFGDLLLEQVAQRFKETVRDYDVVARLGGDEFVILLLDTNIKSSMQTLERIYQHIIGEYMLQNKRVSIGASIGVSFFPSHGVNYADLVHKADIAMYQAKESTGGIKLFDPEMQDNSGSHN